jgi:hypothetical protein
MQPPMKKAIGLIAPKNLTGRSIIETSALGPGTARLKEISRRQRGLVTVGIAKQYSDSFVCSPHPITEFTPN